MINESDLQLVLALVHDAGVLCIGSTAIDERDLAILQQEMLIAESLLSGTASDEDRISVYELVHPLTRSLLLPD